MGHERAQQGFRREGGGGSPRARAGGDGSRGAHRKGDKLVILDTRTPEEFRRFCIPGGRNVPGGELSLRITDITRDLDRDTTIIVNCAGRTRSIIGTRVLQRMGLRTSYGLKNGTAGWVLAGEQLETGAGAERTQLSAPSPEAVAAAEAYAARLAAEDGVRYLDGPGTGAHARAP